MVISDLDGVGNFAYDFPMSNAPEKRVTFVGSSYKDLLDFPAEVICEVGFALGTAQLGGKADKSRVMQGFGGANVLEIRDNFQTNTYRAVYTVRFEEAIYVLHCFMKKSTSGIATPKAELDKIESRLKDAREEHEKYLQKKK